MPTTITIDTNSYLYSKNQLESNEVRYKQYFNGIKKLYELNNNKNIDIYISDNSDFFNKDSELKKYINTTSIQIIKNIPNNYGKTNKGSGLIENWSHNKDILNKYDWIIHFEPRQLLQSNKFIDNFLKNPRNLFTIGKEENHFNTGLFVIKTSLLVEFLNNYSPSSLINPKLLSIEYVIFDYLKKNNINFDVLNKMDLFWYDTYANKTIYH